MCAAIRVPRDEGRLQLSPLTFFSKRRVYVSDCEEKNHILRKDNFMEDQSSEYRMR